MRCITYVVKIYLRLHNVLKALRLLCSHSRTYNMGSHSRTYNMVCPYYDD